MGSTMTWSSAIIATTRGATPPTTPTTTPSRRRSARRTSGRVVSLSTSRLLSTRQSKSRTPLVKDCNIEGPEICRTEYESECWTKQEEHKVEDDVVECRTEVEEKCEETTSGYTTNT